MITLSGSSKLLFKLFELSIKIIDSWVFRFKSKLGGYITCFVIGVLFEFVILKLITAYLTYQNIEMWLFDFKNQWLYITAFLIVLLIWKLKIQKINEHIIFPICFWGCGKIFSYSSNNPKKWCFSCLKVEKTWKTNEFWMNFLSHTLFIFHNLF